MRTTEPGEMHMPLGRRSNLIESDQPEHQEEVMSVTTTDAPATDAPATPDVLNGVTTEDKAKRGRPKLADLPQVSLDDLGDDADVPEDEWGSVVLTDRDRSAAPRSDSQKKVDTAVKAIHESWVAAGKPQLALAPRKRYTVKPEFEATTRGMLTSAAMHNKVRVIHDTLHNGQGMAVITFTAMDRPVKVKTPDKTPVTTDTLATDTPAAN
jgi:hypothetical protein